MCRLFALRSAEQIPAHLYCLEAPHALLKQSCGDRTGRRHQDGWGIGYFADSMPLVLKSGASASSDPIFETSARQVQSNTVIGHIRDASVGELSAANSHPFTHGTWMFAHNGTLTPFNELSAAILAETASDLLPLRQGTTDSEHVFYWLLTRMHAAGMPPDQPCNDVPRLSALLAQAVLDLHARSEAAQPKEQAKLNFVLTDGNILVATRSGHTLALLQKPGLVVLASESITDEPWTDLPDGSVIAINAELQVEMKPFTAFA